MDSLLLKEEQGEEFYMRYVPKRERKPGEHHPHLTSTEIRPTDVLVRDIDILEEKPTYYEDGFELCELSEEALAHLPNVTVDTENIDYIGEISRVTKRRACSTKRLKLCALCFAYALTQ